MRHHWLLAWNEEVATARPLPSGLQRDRMAEETAGLWKVQHERRPNADGVHRDDIWRCESDATHTFIKFYGPNRVEIGDTALDDEQHVLIRDGFCPLCNEDPSKKHADASGDAG